VKKFGGASRGRSILAGLSKETKKLLHPLRQLENGIIIFAKTKKTVESTRLLRHSQQGRDLLGKCRRRGVIITSPP